MGNLFSSLVRMGSWDACDSSPQQPLALKFSSDIEPQSDEVGLCATLRQLLERADALLPQIRDYEGCGLLIRTAISEGSSASDNAAMRQLIPSVVILKACYELCNDIESHLPAVLAMITAPSEREKRLIDHQATVNAFLRLAAFVAVFDNIKISKPVIQNDFSYYRRSLSRRKSSPSPTTALPTAPPSPNGEQELPKLPVNEDLANRMSFFYAYPSPMLKKFIDSSVAYSVKSNAGESLGEVLGLLANYCRHVSSSTEHSGDIRSTYVRAMTVLLVIYDHVHPTGLFLRPIHVALRAHLRAIHATGGEDTNNMLNSLKYSTKNFSSPDVPRHVRALFETPVIE